MSEARGISGAVLVDIDIKSVPLPSEDELCLPLPQVTGILNGRRVQLQPFVLKLKRTERYVVFSYGHDFYGVPIPRR